MSAGVGTDEMRTDDASSASEVRSSSSVEPVARGHRWMDARWAPWAMASLAGTLVFLSFPTFDVFPLAFVAWVPLLLFVDRGGVGRAFALGWWMGLVANVGGFYWVIHLLRDFAFLPLWLCVLLMVLLAAQQGLAFGLGAGLGRFAVRSGLPPWAAYPLAIVVADAFWPMIFKWNLGHSQYKNHALAQIAEWGGAPLVTAVLVTTSMLLVRALTAPREVPSRRIAWASVFAVVVLSHAVGAVRLWRVDGVIAQAPTLRVALIEADIGIYEKSDPERFRNNLLLHQHLSAEAEAQGAELIVWPETAYLEHRKYVTTAAVDNVEDARRASSLRTSIPAEVTWMPPSQARLSGSWRDDDGRIPVREIVPPQRGFRTPLLTGTVLTHTLTETEAAERPQRRGRPPQTQAANSAVLLNEEGRVLGTYDKIALMPFSERVPLGPQIQRWFGIDLYAILPSAGDFLVGRHVRTLDLPRGDGDAWRLGMMICYEDIMPRHGRRLVRENERVDMIVNITNDAWFGKTSEPWLHMALSTFRSIETRTSMVRSTNTGISCAIDPAGRVLQHTSMEDAEILLHDMPMVSARRTLYVRLGDAFAWALAVTLTLWIFVRRRRRVPEI